MIWPAVLAAALGLVLLAGAGFVWADLLDDGALAGRIYFALPCH